MTSHQALLETKEELELIHKTLSNLPKDNKVLRSINGRLVPHTVQETLPAIGTQLAVVKEAISASSSGQGQDQNPNIFQNPRGEPK